MQIVQPPRQTRRSSASRRGAVALSGSTARRPYPLLDRAYGDGGTAQFAQVVAGFGSAISVPEISKIAQDPTPSPAMRRAQTLAGVVTVAIMRHPREKWISELEKTTSISVARAVQKGMKNFMGLPNADGFLIALTFVFFEAAVSEQAGDPSTYTSGYRNALNRFEHAIEKLRRGQQQKLAGLGAATATTSSTSPTTSSVTTILSPSKTAAAAYVQAMLKVVEIPDPTGTDVPKPKYTVPKLREEFKTIPALAAYNCWAAYRDDRLRRFPTASDVVNGPVTFAVFEKEIIPAIQMTIPDKEKAGAIAIATFNSVFRGDAIQKAAGSTYDSFGLGMPRYLSDAQIEAMFDYVFDSIYGNRFTSRQNGQTGEWVAVDTYSNLPVRGANGVLLTTAAEAAAFWASGFVNKTAIRINELVDAAREKALSGGWSKWSSWGLTDSTSEGQLVRAFSAGLLPSYAIWKDPRMVAQAYKDALGFVPTEARIATIRVELLTLNLTYEAALAYISANPTDVRTRSDGKNVYNPEGIYQYQRDLIAKNKLAYYPGVARPAGYGTWTDIKNPTSRVKSFLIASGAGDELTAGTLPTQYEMGLYNQAAKYTTDESILNFMRSQEDLYNPVITAADMKPPDKPGPIEEFFDWASTKIADAFSFIGDLIVQAGVAASDALCKGFKFLFGDKIGGFLCTLISAILKFVTTGLAIGMMILGAVIRLAMRVIELIVGFADSGGVSDYSRGQSRLPPAVASAFKAIFIIFGEITIMLVGQFGAGLAGIPATNREYDRLVKAEKAAGRDGTAIPPSIEKIAQDAATSDPFLIIKVAIAVLTIVLSGGSATPVAIAGLGAALAPIAVKIYSPVLAKKETFKGVAVETIEKGLNSLVQMPLMVITGAMTIVDIIKKIAKDITRFLLKVKLMGEQAVAKVWNEQAKEVVAKFNVYIDQIKKCNLSDLLDGLSGIVSYLPVIVIALAAASELPPADANAQAYAAAEEQFQPNAKTLQEANDIWDEALRRAITDLSEADKRAAVRNQIYTMKSKMRQLCETTPENEACKLYAEDEAAAARAAVGSGGTTVTPPVTPAASSNTAIIAAAAVGLVAVVALSGSRA